MNNAPGELSNHVNHNTIALLSQQMAAATTSNATTATATTNNNNDRLASGPQSPVQTPSQITSCCSASTSTSGPSSLQMATIVDNGPVKTQTPPPTTNGPTMAIDQTASPLCCRHADQALAVSDPGESLRSPPPNYAKSQRQQQTIIRKFQKLDAALLSSTPAPDVKIGQRVSYKEYYGNEFGTIRWIGRVPQISFDWTIGVEFDNAIGEGDGSLNGRRYFIAKDCFAKFLPLASVVLVEQHVGRPEPGTMISVMSASTRPGQMISIQRVSTVHVQHCFLNAPHRRHETGAEILAVNTRLHCQCPNCGPCAHVVKPPRTQRLRIGKNATHMCQFSTYTCCGMESQEDALCAYVGNRVSSTLPSPTQSRNTKLVGGSWIEGSGYLTSLQAQQSALMPEEYRLGAAPDDVVTTDASNRSSIRRRGSGKRRHKGHCLSPINDYREQTHRRKNNDQKPHADQESASPDRVEQHQSELALVSSTANNSKPGGEGKNAFTSPPPPTLPTSDEFNQKTFTTDSQQKGPKIVYRDSIENRYLFPTDEPIDSTLEADLEDLSQARYGHCSSSRPTASQNILRSLRSLVSCLRAAKSNHGGYADSCLSESVLRINEQQVSGAGVNKAQPNFSERKCNEYYDYDVGDENRSKHFASSSPSTLSSAQSTASSTTEKIRQFGDFPLVKQQQPQQRQWNSNSNSNFEIGKVDFQFPAPPTNLPTVAAATTATMARELYGHQLRHDSGGQRSSNGSCAATTIMSHVKRQISSSSDYGFSSASQNSINFAHSHPSCSPIMSIDDEQKRMNQIYKRIAAKLISSTASIADNDLLRLKRALFERPHSNGCCLHDNSSNQNLNYLSFDGNDECEQIIADIIQKSRFNSASINDQEKKSGEMQKNLLDELTATRPLSASCCEFQQNNSKLTMSRDSVLGNPSVGSQPSCELRLTIDGSEKHFNSHTDVVGGTSTNSSAPASNCESCCKEPCCASRNCRQSGKSNTFSTKFTSNAVQTNPNKEIESATANACDSKTLPKAFELKLTLSINSDKATLVQTDAAAAAKPNCGVTDQKMEVIDGRTTVSCDSGSEPNVTISVDSHNNNAPASLEGTDLDCAKVQNERSAT